MKFVSVLMGSKNDYDVIKEALRIFDDFGVKYEVLITSAHRSPQRTQEYVKEAEVKGAKVFIAAAGMAAHLAGAVAAHTTKPVLGVPISGSNLVGMDSLFSTVQMPSGIPVATLAIGKAGAINAAYLAIQILAINDENLASKLLEDRIKQQEKLSKDSSQIEIFL
ncbi:5-(carboxyamino)imidazole ribonucleotide mutase [Campylobacter volucris]|uniref:N5-carboxyaminoimidazole ribonucleotide mutase n=1 Tax=Campylobacter volucris TaxID=1031542 RepID=A0AAE5YIX9_9BACT|nr:5-(carboxyamino)imidazole ribonucleotide mutase [Campylobacter volucris]AJC94282.1 5-aminoimidazole ribonucleotide (AIR) carboxylase [Campylobacter volucris LMG 24379]KAB0580434.1 5-(carboxyamino)imidazole ribonucleotide mutase [Campylobacter volucris]MBF7044055.1 5-(carboxyamino)imidazole ribonucleotide mutase [Campylobacter volucris]QBL13354.1 5-(carboxyamino)imidazole ribonucleotide mutase [Campylobacter volucris]QEL08498.1 5-aminoimidazole ribonucleotide (AIR) carboxylase [Campylobacter